MTVHISTGKKITFDFPGMIHDESYPQKWFQKHPGQKPAINVTLFYGSLDILRGLIREQLISHKIDILLVKEYLYFWGLTVQAVCNEKWESYGVKICDQNTTINPWSLLSVKTVDAKNKDKREKAIVAESTKADDVWIVQFLLGIYRMLNSTNEMHKAALATKIEKHIGSHNRVPGILSVVPYCQSWVSDKDFTKMIAALDMFFFRFKEHRYASLRVGTITSRYKDCAAVNCIDYLLTILGLKNTSELLDWIFFVPIANEINNIMSSDEEVENQYSYFPYQIELGIVTQSAYSTSCRPSISFFAHIVGTLMDMERSKNARVKPLMDSYNLIQNAKIVAYIFATNQSKSKQDSDITPDNSNDQKTKEPVQMLESDGITIVSRDAKKWIEFMVCRDLKLTPAMESFISAAKSRIKNPREGTVGMYVQSNF